MRKIQLEPWGAFEKLCLVTVMHKLRQTIGDQNWAAISRHTKQMYENIGYPLGREKKPDDWFSIRQCAAQYDQLIKDTGIRKKKRTDRHSDQADDFDLLEPLLRQELIEEIKQITLPGLRQEYMRAKRIVEDIDENRLTEEQLEELMLECEDESMDIRSMLDEKNSESENSPSKPSIAPLAQTEPPIIINETKTSSTSPLLTSLLQSPSPLIRSLPSTSSPNISLLLNSSPPVPITDSTLSKLLETPSIQATPPSVITALPLPSSSGSQHVSILKNVCEEKTIIIEDIDSQKIEEGNIIIDDMTCVEQVGEEETIIIEDIDSQKIEEGNIIIEDMTCVEQVNEEKTIIIEDVTNVEHDIVESEIIIEQQESPTAKKSLPRRIELEVEDEETEEDVLETVEQIIDRVEEAIIETVGESNLSDLDLAQSDDPITIDSDIEEQLDIDREQTVEVIVLDTTQGMSGSTNNEAVIISGSPVKISSDTLFIDDSPVKISSDTVVKDAPVKISSDTVVIDDSSLKIDEDTVILDDPSVKINNGTVIIDDQSMIINIDDPSIKINSETVISDESKNTKNEPIISEESTEIIKKGDFPDESVVNKIDEDTVILDDPSVKINNGTVIIDDQSMIINIDDPSIKINSETVISNESKNTKNEPIISEESTEIIKKGDFPDESVVNKIDEDTVILDDPSVKINNGTVIIDDQSMIINIDDPSIKINSETVISDESKNTKNEPIISEESTEIIKKGDFPDESVVNKIDEDTVILDDPSVKNNNGTVIIDDQSMIINIDDPSIKINSETVISDESKNTKNEPIISEESTEIIKKEDFPDESVVNKIDEDTVILDDPSVKINNGTVIIDDQSMIINIDDPETVISDESKDTKNEPIISEESTEIIKKGDFPDESVVNKNRLQSESNDLLNDEKMDTTIIIDENKPVCPDEIIVHKKVSVKETKTQFKKNVKLKKDSKLKNDVKQKTDTKLKSDVKLKKDTKLKNAVKLKRDVVLEKNVKPNKLIKVRLKRNKGHHDGDSTSDLSDEVTSSAKITRISENIASTRPLSIRVRPLESDELREHKVSLPASMTSETRQAKKSDKPVKPLKPGMELMDEDRDQRAWKKSVMLVYNRLASHKYASVFTKPITENDAPGYHDAVLRPMDLSTIKKHIESGIIRTTVEFQRDVILMVQNAIMYNKYDTPYSKMALEMGKDMLREMEIMVQALGDGVPLGDNEEKQKPRSRLSKSSNDEPTNKRKKHDFDEGTVAKRLRSTSS